MLGDLGSLDSATSRLSGSGIIAQDPDCTSSQRDPDDTTSTYYARRHSFTLAAASSVSFGHGGSYRRSLLIRGSSSGGSGTVLARDGASHLVLAAGTYTIEATTTYAGWTGDYSVWVQRVSAVLCDESLEDLSGTLSGTLTSNCTSQQRDGDAATTHYAKRYTFTVDSPVWLTAELKSDPGQTPALDTYLLLMTGHGPNGVVIERADGGGVGTDAEIADRYLAAGDYTIEVTTGPAVGAGASGSSSARSGLIATVGAFNLARTVQTPTEAAGNAVVGGLTQAVWMEQGQTLKLPFSFAYHDTAASSGTPELSGGLIPQVSRVRRLFIYGGPNALLVPSSELDADVSFVDGSGTISLAPETSASAVPRTYLVALAFTGNVGPQNTPSVVGRAGFVVKVCPVSTRPASSVVGPCTSPATPAKPTIQGIPRPSNPATPPVALESCIEVLPRQRWHMIAGRSWPDMTSPVATRCVFPGATGRPALYFVFEVASETEVTVRLSSSQSNRLMLLGPVTTTGSTSSVSISTEVDCDARSAADRVGCVHDTDQTGSRIVVPGLDTGTYVAVVTVPPPSQGQTSSPDGTFRLNIKIPYPAGSCPSFTVAAGGGGSAGRAAAFAGPPGSAVELRHGESLGLAGSASVSAARALGPAGSLAAWPGQPAEVAQTAWQGACA